MHDSGLETLGNRSRSPASTPIVFDSRAGRVFGWYHAPASPERRVGVVLCTPIGYEWLCSYASYVKLAERLAVAGFPVLRFDYHGTGDSAGDDRDEGRVDAWLESTRGAIDELVARSGRSRVALVGVRIGALVAGLVAVDDPRVDDLVLFAPCTTGRSFVRELRAYALSQRSDRDEHAARAKLPGEPYEEAAGFAFTESTLASLSSASLLTLEKRPTAHALVVPRDDVSDDAKLVSHFRSLACDVTVDRVPGYARMMSVASHVSEVPTAVFERIASFLEDRHPEAFARTTPARSYAPSVRGDEDVVKESAHAFGTKHRLFGMLTEPSDRALAEGKPALLVLNVGTNHRVGPNRMYVRMARRWASLGYRSLRFDLAGMGDSEATEQWAAERIYTRDAVDDVVTAMDSLSRSRGIDRFVLVGLCSGAFVAYQTAVADPRSTGLLLINPRRFYREPVEELGTLHVALQGTAYKSMRAYRKLALDRTTWKRLVRGEIDVRGIAKRAWIVGEGRARAVAARAFSKRGESALVAPFRSLCDRGTDVRFVFSDGDDGIDYVELHLGRGGARVERPGRLSVETVVGSDHTFSTLGSQELLSDLIARSLEAGFGAERRG